MLFRSAQPAEWNHDAELPWALAAEGRHAGVQRLVRDLNALYRLYPALHRLDCEAAGFEWLVSTDAEQSVFAWLRCDEQGNSIMVVCNFTPMPRHAYRIGMPGDAQRWRELLNTDAAIYGGNNLGNGPEPLATEALAAHGQPQSLSLSLPPLATLFLAPA